MLCGYRGGYIIPFDAALVKRYSVNSSPTSGWSAS